MARASAKPLWQYGIDRLWEEYEADLIVSLNRKQGRRLARAMRTVGERPTYREVSRYIGEHWNRWADVAKWVREGWRSVDRAEGTFGHETNWYNTPLQLADALIEAHEPQNRTEARLATVAHDAVDALVEAAEEADTAAYLKCKREVADALRAVHHLRYLRQGSGALGFKSLNPGAAPRPRW
jgi:hypothetical protein